MSISNKSGAVGVITEQVEQPVYFCAPLEQSNENNRPVNNDVIVFSISTYNREHMDEILHLCLRHTICFHCDGYRERR